MHARGVKGTFLRRPRATDFKQDDTLADAIKNLSLASGNGPIAKFDNMGLKSNLLKGIYSYGLEKPARAQQLAILPGIQGKDLILQAQSGMGKTAAMAVILLQRVNTYYNSRCQAMVLVPTWELAVQVHGVICAIGKYMDIKAEVCIGGTGASQRQDAKLRQGGTHIIVGTLGRLNNIIDNKVIDPLALNMFVMDEADKMLLDGSVRRDVRNILSKISGNAQMILMSATMPKRALAFGKEISYKPVTFLVDAFELTLEGIRQVHVKIDNDEISKLDTLCELLLALGEKHVIVFCNTRKGSKRLFRQLIDRGVNATCIDGDKYQRERAAALERFRTSDARVMIASDILGRGIDVQQVHAVINYDFPNKVEEYIHRVGRAGRYGRKGTAITFVKDEQVESFKKLELFYDTIIPEMPEGINRYLRI